jgi:hypothetical protein
VMIWGSDREVDDGLDIFRTGVLRSFAGPVSRLHAKWTGHTVAKDFVGLTAADRTQNTGKNSNVGTAAYSQRLMRSNGKRWTLAIWLPHTIQHVYHRLIAAKASLMRGRCSSPDKAPRPLCGGCGGSPSC